MSASNWPLGLSSCGSQGMERAVFQGYAQAGIRYMEVSLDAYRYAALNLDAPKSYAQEAGVRLWSIHLPFNREFYNIAHLDSSRRAACLLEYCRLLEKASKAGISVAVVHPSSEPIDGAERALAMRQAKQKPQLFGMLKFGRLVSGENGLFTVVYPKAMGAAYVKMLSIPEKNEEVAGYLTQAAGYPCTFRAAIEGTVQESDKAILSAQEEARKQAENSLNKVFDMFGRENVRVKDE
mgnify:CR=1 FL=1